MSLRSILVVIFFLAVLGAAPALGQEYSEAGNLLTRLTVKGVPVTAEVVSTPQKTYLGLGRRQNLPEGTGMLFILRKTAYQTFCMRDMLIPIDIIWIADGKVAGITPKLSPSDRGGFTSPVPVRLVLEVPAGFAERHGIQVGEPVSLEIQP